MNIPDSDLKRIVIIGGGFAGISLAKKLRNKNYQVVMMDKHNYHTFQPLLYQVATGGLEPDSIAYPIRKVIKEYKDFYFRLGDVKEIERNSMSMKTIPQSLNIRSLILESFEAALLTDDEAERESLMNFVLVGGGPTGVELAGALAEMKKAVLPKDYPDLDINRMQIHLVQSGERILDTMSEKSSIEAEKFLTKLGVNVHKNVRVTGYDSVVVSTNADLEFHSSTVIWTAGVAGKLISGINKDAIFERIDRIKVDSQNKVNGYENIFAIGDICIMETAKYPKGHPQMAQAAMQQGSLLAENLINLQNNKPLKAFEYKDKGSMATIGRNNAVVDLPKFHFSGVFAWFVWMFVHLISLIGFKNKAVVFLNWVYNYIRFDREARLIIRPYKKKMQQSFTSDEV